MENVGNGVHTCPLEFWTGRTVGQHRDSTVTQDGNESNKTV